MGSGMAAPEGKVIIVGVTGASGAILAQTALRLLAADERVARVHLVVSDAGRRLLDHELGVRGALGELPGGIVGASAGKGVTAAGKNRSAAQCRRGRFHRVRQLSGGCHVRDSLFDGHAIGDCHGREHGPGFAGR